MIVSQAYKSRNLSIKYQTLHGGRVLCKPGCYTEKGSRTLTPAKLIWSPVQGIGVDP